MSNEQVLSNFMRANYSDERLSWLLAHAEGGLLTFSSCCCFIGIATADHALRGLMAEGVACMTPHYLEACELPGAWEAEKAYLWIGDYEPERRAKLIPLINAEIERRDRERSFVSSVVCVGV